MNQQKITEELLGLEKKYWQAIKDKDIDAALIISICRIGY